MNSIACLNLFFLVVTISSQVRAQYYPYNVNYYAQGGNNRNIYRGGANRFPRQNNQYQYGNQQPNANAWASSSIGNQYNGGQVSAASSFSYSNGGQASAANSFSYSNGGVQRPIRMPQGNNQMHHGGKKNHSNKRKRYHPRRPNSQRYKDFRAVYHELEQRSNPDTFNATQEEHDSNDDFNGRSIVAPGQYPHMAAIGFRTQTHEVEFKCGGSLISELYVLTAAHCCYLNGQQPNVIKIGDIRLKERERDLKPQRRRVAQIFVHPLYNSAYHYHDIALIQLNTPIEYTHFVRPIRLWAQDEITYEKVFTMGYGSTSFAQSPTNILTELDLSIVPLDVCNATMPPEEAAPEGITEGQLCAKDYIKHRDTCQGDSGGPLQLNLERRRNRNNKKKFRYYLVGITSYGTICRSEYPGIYTKVSWYVDWIASIVWPNYFEDYDGY